MQKDSFIKSYTYDAYGNTFSTGTFINSFAYTGAVIDTQTGLYYMNARYYEPETGQFISEDTYRGDGEAFWHLYAYCNGDPVNNTDPSGHRFIVEPWAGRRSNKRKPPIKKDIISKTYSEPYEKSFYIPSPQLGGVLLFFTTWYVVGFDYEYRYVNRDKQFLSVTNVYIDNEGIYTVYFTMRGTPTVEIYKNKTKNDSIKITIRGKWTTTIANWVSNEIGIPGTWILKWSRGKETLETHYS